MCSQAQDIHIFEKPVILFTVCSCCSKSVNHEDLSHRAMAQRRLSTLCWIPVCWINGFHINKKTFTLILLLFLNVNHPSIFFSCSFEDVPLVEFLCLVFTCKPGESYHR